MSDDRPRSSEPSRDADSDETSSPYPFPTRRDDGTFASLDLDQPPTEANTDGRDSRAAKSGRNDEVSSKAPLVQLTIQPPGGETRKREVGHSRFLLGRDHADLIVDDPFISTWHAQLFVDDDTLLLQDMNSYNGVFLRIADELVLEDRDELVMGQQRFVFRSEWNEPTSDESPDRNVTRLGAPLAGSPVCLFRMVAGERIAGLHEVGDGLTIGGTGCDIACPEDLGLSTPHAEIVRENGSFVLRDLESESGTFIRIDDAVEVVDGDCFVVGRTRLEVTCL